MEWRFSDGTVMRLGGVVEGDGPLAKRIRDELSLLPYGRTRQVNVRPEPGGSEPFNPDDPYHVDSWTADLMRFTRGVELISAPVLPKRDIEPYPSEPGIIY